MISRGRFLRSAGLGAAATPVVIALLARWSLGGAPMSAHATIEDHGSKALVTPLPRLTDSQRSVAEYAQAALAQPFASSPLHGVAPAVENPAAEDQSPGVSVVTPEQPAPAFNVKSVLVSSKGALATINGRLRRIGDEIEPQWRLSSIDVENGVVRISGPGERLIEIPIGHLIR